MRHLSPRFQDRVMDALTDYPQTAGDLAERLQHHVDTVHLCLRKLAQKGLVEQAGKVRRMGLWRMARTRRG
jgi:DNA-binding IclR family transcriptional regulator